MLRSLPQRSCGWRTAAERGVQQDRACARVRPLRPRRRVLAMAGRTESDRDDMEVRPLILMIAQSHEGVQCLM